MGVIGISSLVVIPLSLPTDSSSLGGALMVTQQTQVSSHSDLGNNSSISGQTGRQVTDRGESHFSSTSSWVSSRTCSDGRTLSYIQSRNPLTCK